MYNNLLLSIQKYNNVKVVLQKLDINGFKVYRVSEIGHSHRYTIYTLLATPKI